MHRIKTIVIAALAALMMAPALGHAAPSTEQVEQRTQQVLDRRYGYIYKHIARCVQTGPTRWNCRIISILLAGRFSEEGKVKVRSHRNRIYVGPIR